jgi:hypothetical protein
MKNKVLTFPFYLVIILIGLVSSACLSSMGKVLARPHKLTIYDTQYGFQSTLKEPKPWTVFADREGMIFYQDDRCQTENGRTAQFMQRFFVSRVSSDQKALYLVDARLERRLVRSRVTREYGWAKVGNLLPFNILDIFIKRYHAAKTVNGILFIRNPIFMG